MKKSMFFLIALCAISMTSCHTALKVAEVRLETHDKFGDEKMEFIGFRNLNRNNVFVKNYGVSLERQHLAINKQEYYMGIYSMQELAAYKSTKRYVAFIDVINHAYVYNDAISDKPGLAIGGWVVAGFTCFTLFPVYLPMILCADKNECLITLKGEYILYLYDTEKKEVALTIPMQINEQERYNGQYVHTETDKLAVQERYRNMLYTLWTESFAKAYDFIEQLQP